MFEISYVSDTRVLLDDCPVQYSRENVKCFKDHEAVRLFWNASEAEIDNVTKWFQGVCSQDPSARLNVTVAGLSHKQTELLSCAAKLSGLFINSNLKNKRRKTIRLSGKPTMRDVTSHEKAELVQLEARSDPGATDITQVNDLHALSTRHLSVNEIAAHIHKQALLEGGELSKMSVKDIELIFRSGLPGSLGQRIRQIWQNILAGKEILGERQKMENLPCAASTLVNKKEEVLTERECPSPVNSESTVSPQTSPREIMTDIPTRVVTPDSGSLGTFFFNKVYTDEAKQKYWTPERKEVSQILEFKEIFPVDQLEQVLVVTDEWYQDPQFFCQHFPRDANLTVVCPAKKQSSKACSSELKECPDHRPEFIQYDEYDELISVSCECPNTRDVLLIHPEDSTYLQANFVILRYNDRVRIVISSATFNKVCWENLIEFGWLCDLPFNEEWAFQSDEAFTKTGVFVAPKEAYRVGIMKIEGMLKNAMWPQCRENSELIYQTHYIGHMLVGGFVNTFSKVFACGGREKIVFPVYDSVKIVIDEQPEIQKTFYNNDKRFQSQPHLYKVAEDAETSRLNHSNFLFYQVPQPDDTQEQYTMLYIGSHGYSQSIWGETKMDKGSKAIRIVQYAMGVVIAPFLDKQNEEILLPKLIDVDLPVVVNKLEKYAHGDIPYYNPNPENPNAKRYFTIGRFQKPVSRDFGFMRKLEPGDPLTDLSCSPNQYDSTDGLPDAFLHKDVFIRSGFSPPFPPNGTPMEYIATTERSRGKDAMRVQWVLRCGESIEKKETVDHVQRLQPAKDLFGSSTSISLAGIFDEPTVCSDYTFDTHVEKTDSGPVTVITSPEHHKKEEKDTHRKLSGGSASFREKMKHMGPHSENTIEEHMQKWFSGKHLMTRWKKPAPDVPLFEPPKILSREKWLERHITRRYGANVKLEGPLLYPNLMLRFRELEDWLC